MGADQLKVTAVRTRWDEARVPGMVVAQHPRCQGTISENGVELEHSCGRMYLSEREDFVGVTGMGVDYYAQRGGLGFRVGTKLYEEAARLSCEIAGKPLASDWNRTAKAEAFWKKQVAKGRARYDADVERYVLSCPATTLDRAARRRRR